MAIGTLIAASLIYGLKDFSFSGSTYVHRYTKGNLHEFTPKVQSDLSKWTDMLTVNAYPNARNGDQLAATANAVLETYKKAGGAVLRTNSVPRTKGKEAEHFIAVIFVGPQFAEAAFARFRIRGGAAESLVYSHRIYGKSLSDAIGKWVAANGPAREKSLMALSAWPTKG